MFGLLFINIFDAWVGFFWTWVIKFCKRVFGSFFFWLFYILSEGEITEKIYNQNQELINNLMEKIKEKRQKEFIQIEEEEKEEKKNKIERIESKELLKNNFENNSIILIK